MKTLGNRAIAYCEYCHARGIWNGSVYCPCSPPNDCTAEEKQRSGTGYPWTATGYSLDRNNLPLRTDTASRRAAFHIVKDLCTECPKKIGIKGESILLQLSSIDFPRSFPPDMMHLFFENIVPSLFRHYRGVFIRSNCKTRSLTRHRAREPEATSTRGSRPASPCGIGLRRTPTVESDTDTSSDDSEEENQPVLTAQPKSQRRRGGAEKLAKFVATDDPWNIPPHQWKAVGDALDSSAASFPLAFGDPLRNFSTHCHQLKAAEWAIVAKQASPIFLKSLLPSEDYQGFLKLVDAMLILERHAYTTADIEAATSLLEGFSQYYADRFYRQEWENLRVCLPTFHQLLHVKDALRAVGLMYGYWQWPTERLCGMITQTAKSRSSANENMSNVMVKEEQRNHLPFVLPLAANDHVYDGDDGQLRLADMLTKHLTRRSDALSCSVPDLRTIAEVILTPPFRHHVMDRNQRRCFRGYLDKHDHADDSDYEDYVYEPDKCLRYSKEGYKK